MLMAAGAAMAAEGATGAAVGAGAAGAPAAAGVADLAEPKPSLLRILAKMLMELLLQRLLGNQHRKRSVSVARSVGRVPSDQGPIVTRCRPQMLNRQIDSRT